MLKGIAITNERLDIHASDQDQQRFEKSEDNTKLAAINEKEQN